MRQRVQHPLVALQSGGSDAARKKSPVHGPKQHAHDGDRFPGLTRLTMDPGATATPRVMAAPLHHHLLVAR